MRSNLLLAGEYLLPPQNVHVESTFSICHTQVHQAQTNGKNCYEFWKGIMLKASLYTMTQK